MREKSKNLANFLKLVSPEKTDTLQKVCQQIKERSRIRVSQKIAIAILIKIDQLGWSKEKLSKESEIQLERINVLLTGKASFYSKEKKIFKKVLRLKNMN
jgi:predicted XRE-type DNA-binding protein